MSQKPRYNFDPNGIPIIYEDEVDHERGEIYVHTASTDIIHICLSAYFARRPEYRVFSNMCLYQDLPEECAEFVSPDVMVVMPVDPMPIDIERYQIGLHGPAPLVTVEALSHRSIVERDLTYKVKLYGELRIPEYILIDVAGLFLEEPLVLKRLQADGTWQDEIDNDGGVTSQLGFRILIDQDGLPRVVNAATGCVYPRPAEAMLEQVQRLEQALGLGQESNE